MTTELLLAFIAFAFVTSVTPGPNNMMLLASGVNFGLRRSLPHMFGISLGYEIRGGRLGRAIRDTTISGSALKVLGAVDGVGSEMKWNCSGYCGKKQPMVVSLGGPALRTRAHLGGQ